MTSLTSDQERRQVAAAEAADILAVASGRYARREVTAGEVIALASWILGTSGLEAARGLAFMPRVGSFK